MNYCFGVDIGGTTVKMGLFQFDGELVEKWEFKQIHNGGHATCSGYRRISESENGTSPSDTEHSWNRSRSSGAGF